MPTTRATGRLAFRTIPGPAARRPVRKGPWGLPDRRDQPDRKVQSAQPVPRDRQVHKDPKAFRVRPVQPDQPGPRDQQAHKGPKDFRGQPEQQAQLALKDPQVHKGLKGPRVRPAQPGPRARPA